MCRLDPNKVYPKSELKAIIQSVFDGLGISAKAKATDIAKYLPIQEISYTEYVDGKPKKRRGFQVNIDCQVYNTPATIFPRVNDTKNARGLSLGQVLIRIRSGVTIDGASIVKTISNYRETKIVELKESLPVVMWQGVFSE